MKDISQTQRTKVDHLRERYHKRRRKQLAAATGVTVIVLVLAGIITMLVLSVRSCQNKDSAVTIDQYRQEQTEGSLPQKVNVLGVEIAPWLTAMGQGSLLIAGDTSLQEPSYPNYPVNYLALYDYGLRSGDDDLIPAAWSVTLDGTLTDLRIVDQCAVTSNQSLGDPPVFELAGYKLTNGSPEWVHEIEGAQAGQLESAGKVACVSYLLPDGYRLVGYNGSTGIKAWGQKINPGNSLTDISISTPVYLAADNGYLAYFLNSVFGLVDAGTGREIRWLDFGAPIVDYAFDTASQSIFIIIAVGPSSYIVKHLPYRNGIPLDLYAFQVDQEQDGVSLVSDGNRALLTYKPATRAQGIVLVGLEAGVSNPVFTADIRHGTVSDMVTLQSPTTEFLVAVNQYDAARSSAGWGRLYTIGFESGLAVETGMYNQKVSWLASIDSGCMALLHGGRILTYLPQLGQSVELADMKYPGMLPVINNSAEQLAVLSYPAGYGNEEPGCEMQILILD